MTDFPEAVILDMGLPKRTPTDAWRAAVAVCAAETLDREDVAGALYVLQALKLPLDEVRQGGAELGRLKDPRDG